MAMRSTAFKVAAPALRLELDLEPAREQQDLEVELEDGPEHQGSPEDGQAAAASLRKPLRRRLKEGREGWGGLLPLSGPDLFGRIGSQAGALAAKESAGGGAAAVVTGAGAATTAATGQQGLDSVQVSAEGKWKQVRKSPGGSGGGDTGSQAVCLKQIVLLQLDLIEQQQQQLQAKEKEIGELQAERDTLLARIERMERRMQLVKKDGMKEKHRLCQGHEAEEQNEVDVPVKGQSACHQEPLETHQLLTPKPLSCGRSGKGHKRKSVCGNLERKTPVKKLAADFSKLRAKTVKHFPVKDEPCNSLSETVCRRELRSKETPERTRSQVDTSFKLSTLPKDKGYISEAEELPYLATTEMYLCCWHEPPPSPLREPSPKKEESVASKKSRAPSCVTQLNVLSHVKTLLLEIGCDVKSNAILVAGFSLAHSVPSSHSLVTCTSHTL